jgi:hypothetical protein
MFAVLQRLLRCMFCALQLATASPNHSKVSHRFQGLSARIRDNGHDGQCAVVGGTYCR